jgi:cytochrome c-type biogenesis protein
LSEYEGKVVFLNFWATGCPPCQKEIPHIIDLYEENSNDNVVILTVVNPNGFLEKDIDYIMAYIEDKDIPFPVLFDNTGEIFDSYGISSIPTTFMVTDSSKVFGYINGALDRSIMDNIISQTVAYSE